MWRLFFITEISLWRISPSDFCILRIHALCDKKSAWIIIGINLFTNLVFCIVWSFEKNMHSELWDSFICYFWISKLFEDLWRIILPKCMVILHLTWDMCYCSLSFRYFLVKQYVTYLYIYLHVHWVLLFIPFDFDIMCIELFNAGLKEI